MWNFVIIIFILCGLYLYYIKPQKDLFFALTADDCFNNDILVIESNSSYSIKDYNNFQNSLKTFMLHNSCNIKKKYHLEQIQQSLLNLIHKIPDGDRRKEYMDISSKNLISILKNYIK